MDVLDVDRTARWPWLVGALVLLLALVAAVVITVGSDDPTSDPGLDRQRCPDGEVACLVGP